MDGVFRVTAGGASDDSVVDGAPRKRSRDSMFLLAALRLEDEDAPREVRVRNLSAGGLMAEVGRDVALDAAVKLSLRGVGDVSGRVVWSVDGRIGVALDRAIDPRAARKPVAARAAPRR